MPKAERMANLMHIGLEGIAIYCRTVTVEPADTDVYACGGDEAIAHRRRGKSPGPIVVKYDIAARTHFYKCKVGDIGLRKAYPTLPNSVT
jgi:hypothetical protein